MWSSLVPLWLGETTLASMLALLVSLALYSPSTARKIRENDPSKSLFSQTVQKPRPTGTWTFQPPHSIYVLKLSRCIQGPVLCRNLEIVRWSFAWIFVNRCSAIDVCTSYYWTISRVARFSLQHFWVFAAPADHEWTNLLWLPTQRVVA